MRVNLEGPNLTPDKNNRFGDARPRNWQENDQFRSRPVITGSNRGEPIKINDSARINRYDDNRSEMRAAGNNRFERSDKPEVRAENSLAMPAPIPQSRSLNPADRSNANAQRFERPSQNESRGFNQTVTMPEPNASIAPQVPTNSSSGIRTVEEMSAERNNQRVRINRIDPIREYRNDVNSNQNGFPVPQSNAEMTVNRPVNVNNERNIERFERRNERTVERAPERMQERIQERPQAAMPREMPQPRQEVRMAEPRRETAPVMRVERTEREKASENRKESKREINEQ